MRFSRLESNDKITKRLCQKYKIDSRDILIDESYTETWAKIFNCYFISTLTNSNTKYQNFCTLLAIEIEFSIYQANKIRKFISDTDDKNIDKNTNITAYYLVVGEIFIRSRIFFKRMQ